MSVFQILLQVPRQLEAITLNKNPLLKISRIVEVSGQEPVVRVKCLSSG